MVEGPLIQFRFPSKQICNRGRARLGVGSCLGLLERGEERNREDSQNTPHQCLRFAGANAGLEEEASCLSALIQGHPVAQPQGCHSHGIQCRLSAIGQDLEGSVLV